VTNKLALIVAVVLGVLSIIGIRAYVDQLRTDFAHKTKPKDYMVATRDLPPGHEFGEDDFEYLPFPSQAIDQALRDSVVTDPTLVRGTKTREQIKAGQILQTYHFNMGGPARGNHALQGKFDKDHRAITMPIGLDSGVGGFLRPGDLVDLVMSMDVKDDKGESIEVTRTLYKGMTILGTGEITDKYDARAGRGGYATLTLKATPRQANTLAHALFNGATFHCVYAQPGTPDYDGSATVIDAEFYWDVHGEVQKIYEDINRRVGRRR